jgi:hypothetical protein
LVSLNCACLRRLLLNWLLVDGVCSVASEELKVDEWGIDVVLTASQKGLGVPPGLSILVASQRAIQTFKTRKAKSTSYYSSWKKWLPIMESYEKGNASYFATPPGTDQSKLTFVIDSSLLQSISYTPCTGRFQRSFLAPCPWLTVSRCTPKQATACGRQRPS